MPLDEVPQFYIPVENGNNPTEPPTTSSPLLRNMSAFSNDFKYDFTPIQVNNYSPLATAINPFFPPLNPAAPSLHKRHRDTPPPEPEDSKPLPSIKINETTDIFGEIQVLVRLEVIQTRYTFRLPA